MSKSNTQTTPQNQTERRPPPSKEDLARMKLIPCNKGINCEHFKLGRCRYSHEGGGRAVQYDSRSHKQLPPTKPALPTEADILARILGLGGFGPASNFMVHNTSDQLAMVRSIYSAIQMLYEIVLTFDSLKTESFEQRVNQAFLHFNSVEKLANVFEQFKTTILNSEHSVDTRKKAISTLLEKIQLPEEVDEILKEFDARRRESLDPLAQAREDPDGIPTREFLNHLANACGLRDNEGFNQMLQLHKTFGDMHKTHGVNSPYTNKSFLGILAVHDATKEAEKLLEAHRLKEMQESMVAEAKAKLLQECLTKSNPSLKIAFRILQAQSEFVKFIQALSENDHETLVAVFGSFMSYLAHSCEKTETQITSGFLSEMFTSFTKSRKVDESTIAFKTTFFDIVHTGMFNELFDILHVSTSSLHGSQNGSSGTQMMVHEIFKYMIKELVDMYGERVPHNERDDFYKGLVRELLPLAFLISLSPAHSNMLAGRWKKGEKDKQGNDVNHYLKMQDSGAKKSIFYWIMMNLNNHKKPSKKNQSSEKCDSFEKLSSQFTCEREMKNEDGSTEIKRIFSSERLFEALREVQKENFLRSVNFPYNIQDFQSCLGTLFSIDKDDSICVSEECPAELLMALYYAFGSNERDPHTRQFSDVKALMHMKPELILEVVQMCQSFNRQNATESVIAIINSLGFEGDQSLEGPLLTLLTLISENESDDLLRRAYDVMSLATTMIEIHNSKDGYFMSLVDALVVVLLTDKFPNVKQFDIMQAVYEAKSKLDCKVFMNFVTIQTFVAGLQDADSRKARLTEFLSIGKFLDKTEPQRMKEKVSYLRDILCIHGLQDGSFHDQIKRVLPFLLDRNSLVGLLKTNTEFEIDSSEFQHSHDECSAVMLGRIKALFEKEVEAFIASQNSTIQRDLKKRMEQIKQLPELAERLKALGLTKHASAIANLVNSLFYTISLPYQLDAGTFTSSFPKTKGLSQSDSAKIVCAHVLSVIGIVKPVEPANPANPANAVESKKSKSKKSTSKESKSEADYKASVAEFALEMERFQMMENIVSRAISAIYCVELPKEEGATFKKVPTIKLSVLSDILLQSNTLVELFGNCLPYWKSPLVREIILSILDHKFKLGDVYVRELYREIQSFGVSVEPSESSSYTKMFSFLNDSEAVLSQTDSYEASDNDIFEQMKQTFESNFWNDSDTEVEISSQVVQRRRIVAIRRRQQDDESETSSGGGPAPEPEDVEVEEESVPVVEFDVNHLRSLLENDSKDNAIAYMDSLSSRDETEEGILELLKQEDSTCQSVLDTVNEVYPN